LTCHDRAHEAGVEDVGLGLLLGAGDYHFDVVALVSHARHLREAYGALPHTISYPRMLATAAAPASQEPQRQISDEDFVFIVAVTRLALPYTGIIMSTPAESEVRRALYASGISEVTVGAHSYPASTPKMAIRRPVAAQYRSHPPAGDGHLPHVRIWVHPQLLHLLLRQRRRDALAQIEPVTLTGDYCAPNALLALKEYVMDFASPETRVVVERAMQAELARMSTKLRRRSWSAWRRSKPACEIRCCKRLFVPAA